MTYTFCSLIIQFCYVFGYTFSAIFSEYYYCAVVIVVDSYLANCFSCFVFTFYVMVCLYFVAGYFYFDCHILFDYLFILFWVILFLSACKINIFVEFCPLVS